MTPKHAPRAARARARSPARYAARARGEPRPRRAAVGRGLPGAVDAGREPDQVAPRAHHLVLRDLPARALRAGFVPSIPPSAFSSTATTRASASSIRGRSAACVTRPDARRGASAIARTSTSACRRCSRARGDDAEIAALVDARPAARAAAPGADPHRHQARAVVQPARVRRYARRWPMAQVRPQPLRWFGYDGGLRRARPCARRSTATFCFDNETPRHRAYAAPFELASRPATYGDFLAFIDDGGYRRPELWLSMGWDWVRSRRARRRRSTGAATAAAG